ncbi:HTH_Tnp_Tc3_2 domain-containing protein [Trichonephila clavipes]|nr:HTH_Tnp_Tc3_2 domain-containing protein [Trichonephila clavipes]
MPGKRARRHFSQLSEFERRLIIGMKTAGWSTHRVAGQVDRSECAVRNRWEQWTREMTRSTLRADVGVAIVPQTISRPFAEANLKSKRPFRALPLTPEHRQLRLQWCQGRSMWNVTDWKNVMFSEESRFVFGQMITVYGCGGTLVRVTTKRNRRSTASDLSRQLSSATGTTVSGQSVHRRLGHIGLIARRPVRCVPLTATHFRLRLTWSREHALWTPQQWSCVIFSDESRFSLQSDSRRTLIWRVPGTRYHPLNDTVTVVQVGSFEEELFLVPELTCMFRV